MKKKYKLHIAHLVIALLFIILLVSCEGETSYTHRVSNFSLDTVSLQIFSPMLNGTKLLFLTPGKSETLFISSKMGGDLTMPDCSNGIDSVAVFIANGKTLKKDFTNPDDWTYSLYSRKNDRFVDHYCDFEIFPIDLGY